MSTPNFALKNASRYFVLGMPVYYTQEDIDENGLDQDLLGKYDELSTECHYDDDKQNVAYELKAKGWRDIDEFDGDRSYPTHLFAQKAESFFCGDTPIDVIIKAGCTSGYYEAANFDWFIKVRIGCDNSALYEPDELEPDDVISQNWYGNRGLSTIHAAHVIRKIQAIIDDLKNEAELAFSMYCDEEMCCAWIASNGEAGYNRTGKRLWQEVEEQNKKTA